VKRATLHRFLENMCLGAHLPEAKATAGGKGGNQENDGCLEFGPSGRRRSKRVFRLRAKAWGLTRAVVCGPDGPASGPSVKKGMHETKKGPPFRVSSPFERIQASMIRKRTRLKRAPFDRSRSSKTVSRPTARKSRRRAPCRARDWSAAAGFRGRHERRQNGSFGPQGLFQPMPKARRVPLKKETGEYLGDQRARLARNRIYREAGARIPPPDVESRRRREPLSSTFLEADQVG